MHIKNNLVKILKDPKNATKRAYYRLDDKTSKKVFGNTIGIKQNIVGKIKKSRYKSSISVNVDEKMIKELKTNQFLKIGRPYDDSLISKIKSKYDKLIEDKNHYFVTAEFDGKDYCRRLIKFEEKIPELKKLLPEKIIDLVKAYYGGFFNAVRIDMWRNYHVPDELIKKNDEWFSNNWHCDRRNTDLFKIFINLSDMTEENGPMHIIPHPRTKELMKMGFKNRLDYGLSDDVLEDPKYLAKTTGLKGSTILANTEYCLHKAGNPSKGKHRDFLQILFAPSNKPLSEDWVNSLEENPAYALYPNKYE